MTTFEGIVTLDDDSVPVTVGLDQEKVTLVAGDVRIGEWPMTECVITDIGDGTWEIEAEQDTLSFLPKEPDRFAQSLNGQTDKPDDVPSVVADEAALVEGMRDSVVSDDPGPKRATVIGFYVLAAITAALGLWAIVGVIV